MSKFIVQILNDKQFDSLPYNNISDSLGIADKDKGLAFVRETGVKEFDLATLSHEIDHLVSKHATHQDRYGIMHKKGSDILKNVVAPIALSLIPGVGPLLAGAYSGINNYQTTGDFGKAALAGGISGAGAMLGQSGAGYQAGVAGSKAAGGGILGQSLSGAKGALLGTAATATAPETAGLIGTRGAVLGLGTVPAATTAGLNATIPGMAGAPGTVISKVPGASVGATLPSGAPAMSAVGSGASLLGSALSPALSQAASTSLPASMPTNINWGGTPAATSNILGGVGSLASTPAATPGIQAPTTFANPNIGSIGTQDVGSVTPENVAAKVASANAKPSLFNTQNILGAGSLLTSQTAVKQPEFQMPESVEQIRSKLLTNQGLTDVGQQARLELGNIMKSTPQELYAPGSDAYYQTVTKNLENEYARQKQALAQQWNAIDPNYQYNGEFQLADDRLNKSYMEVRNNYVAQEEQRRFELARNQKYVAIQESLGVDKNVMDDLVGISGLSAEVAAQIYGAKVADVQAIREALGTVGAELLVRGITGTGIQKQGAITINTK